MYFPPSNNILPLSDEFSVQVTRVVDIPSVVSLLPVKAPDCKLPPAQPLPHSSNITISPVVNLLSPVENPTPNSAIVTPSKFSGKTAQQLTAMSESDQVKIFGNCLENFILSVPPSTVP